MKLKDLLLEDIAQKRFSIISFDTDVPANVKLIRRQVNEERVVGFIAARNPDFEFANFAIEELTEIAARMDEALGFFGDPVRNADWTGVVNARAFENKYKEVSSRQPRDLKGEQWGRALAAYAIEHQKRADTGIERVLWHHIAVALRCRSVRYEFQKEEYRFDPSSFELTTRIVFSEKS